MGKFLVGGYCKMKWNWSLLNQSPGAVINIQCLLINF